MKSQARVLRMLGTRRSASHLRSITANKLRSTRYLGSMYIRKKLRWKISQGGTHSDTKLLAPAIYTTAQGPRAAQARQRPHPYSYFLYRHRTSQLVPQRPVAGKPIPDLKMGFQFLFKSRGHSINTLCLISFMLWSAMKDFELKQTLKYVCLLLRITFLEPLRMCASVRNKRLRQDGGRIHDGSGRSSDESWAPPSRIEREMCIGNCFKKLPRSWLDRDDGLYRSPPLICKGPVPLFTVVS
jgi:hypothetical protein